VSNPSEVKEDYAADMLRDNLRAALKSAGFEIGDSPVKAHLVLDEFTSGRWREGSGERADQSSRESHI
jgi:hypothetical protein